MDNEIMQNQYTDLADNIKKGRLVLEVLCREYTSVFCLDFHNSSLELLKLDSAANAFTEDKMTAINAGMNEHISKPISEDRLLNVLAGFRKK